MVGAEKPEDVVNKARIVKLLREHNEGRTLGEISKELCLTGPRVKGYLNTLSPDYPIGEEGEERKANYYLLDWRTL